MQDQKHLRVWYDQKELDVVEKGIIFSSKPHFIATSKNYQPERPALFIRCLKTQEVFTGYIRGLNPREVSKKEVLEQEYRLIVRGFGSILDDKTRLLFLEEAVEKGDKIYVHILNRTKNREKFFGRFLRYGENEYGSPKERYRVFVYPERDSVRVEEGNYIFGKVEEVCLDRNNIDLLPLSIIGKDSYKRHENIIIKNLP